MFNLSVYEAIEIINAIPEILIIALFYHRIFERKYNSYLPYIISYGIAFAVLSVTSLLVASPYVRIGITFAILLTFAIFLYSGSNTVKFFASVYYLLIVFISETLFVGILVIMGYGNPSELLDYRIFLPYLQRQGKKFTVQILGAYYSNAVFKCRYS